MTLEAFCQLRRTKTVDIGDCAHAAREVAGYDYMPRQALDVLNLVR
jgi:hypothetical protein